MQDMLLNNRTPIRLLKKEGIIFAAGVIFGFFVRSLIAKRSSPIEISKDHENYIDLKKVDESGKGSFHAECDMKVPEIIKHSGYPVEEHEVVTEDGYKLTLHRIPHGMHDSLSSNDEAISKPVVFMQHGLLADSANWVSNGANRSLAFLLADYGFDVWLGNVRGNTYSRKHVTLDPNTDERFWRYSWQQFSEFDLPAMVNFALKETRKEKLYYIGHSQGTLIMFARLAEDPSFNDKIHQFIALGPVFCLKALRSPLRHWAYLYESLEMAQWMMGGAELLPNSEAGKWLAPKLHSFMSDNPDARIQSNNILLNIAGFNPERYCTDRISVYLAHLPAGTSIQNIIHFAQMIATNKTSKYKYSTDEENIKAYGSPNPTEYDLTLIRTPIALYWGSEDWFAVPEDVLSIVPNLKSLIRTKEMKGWDHLEFLYGAEAADSLYRELAELMKEHENNYQKKRSLHSDL